jgi:hypothetical protein
MRRQLISSDEARPAMVQHKRPCSDCPFRRASLCGWLGGIDVQAYLDLAHSDFPVRCHALRNTECAGAAIYRANVAKLSRNSNVLRLEKNTTIVFASPDEFRDHHMKRPWDDYESSEGDE